uniref:NADH dehydrogenase subunit 5 n=1 Tax=Dentathalia scutellariae TaxID=1170499 RepID=UPI00220FC0D5|nr:NADH dehydrogenase subunit 5 [Dentathalia scutellariae]UXW93341.1 NADH dehydrogenase subunit 5 [Dentathalia scutellariae]
MNLCFVFFILFFFFSIFFFWSGVNFMLTLTIYFIEFNILSLNSCSIVMTMLFDWMTLLFLSVVLFISSFVIFYSYYYMENDLNLNRFIILILMFVLSMSLLIVSPNMVSILLGWDGLGLISYCLVIYYQNIKSFNAGMLTILINRLGDVALLMCIAWMMNFGSWNYVFYLNFMDINFCSKLILFFVALACFTKSAQIPFSSWLPAAMAAPTPVSSLVHSSTLVTAGVYLMIRFKDLFVVNNMLIYILLLLSSLTMLMSGINANLEYDLKKVIALSTLSQLGFMMSILFLGAFDLAFFHLLTHALFKALLFMCAGVMIHSFKDIQDIRWMGCINKQMPFSCLCFMFANLSLCGFPFLVGFYSKDLILESIIYMNFNIVIMILLFISTLLTVSYTVRLILFTMFSNFNSFSLNFLNDSSWQLNFSLLGLMLMIIWGGSSLSWLIFPVPYCVILPVYLKVLPIFMIILGSLMGYYIYLLSFKKIFIESGILKMFMMSMWFMPMLSYSLIKFTMKLCNFFFLKMDLNWTEFFMSNMLIGFIKFKSVKMDVMLFSFNKLINLMLFIYLIWIFIIF